ncbi:uncharacterized protein LOC133832131 [Humulus lupulus]|uniref:uncharacterized protein LOC133832131 n=1 Tax=Humulus lupulus TaxID=3486 RepID=UPI002B4079A5|nr:uncharacterized protein LOC133832131 [Humulus lupulus]
MGRKKKEAPKPAAVAVSTDFLQTKPDLPSIQEHVVLENNVEEYHDPCEVLEADSYAEQLLPEDTEGIPGSSKAASWAEEVEKTDYQNSAKDVWSKFKANQVKTPSTSLDFIEPMKVGDQIIAKLDMDEIEVEASFWRSLIVCVVLGANPPFRVFEGFVKRDWGNLGIDRIVRMNSGFALVSFRDIATRDLVLETCVIHFDKKPVVLRPWTSDMDTMQMVKSVPVWVSLDGLGLQYWGRNSLSALVSTIGKPIMIDQVTRDRSMVKFARVLVDMEISETPPKTISFVNERDQLVDQLVEYEWLPSKCKACDCLGHTVVNYSKDKGYIWVKKSNPDTKKPEMVAEKNMAEPSVDNKQATTSQDALSESAAVIGISATSQDAFHSCETAAITVNKSANSNVGTAAKQVTVSKTGVAKDIGMGGEWITPRRRGTKTNTVLPSKAITRNGYAALQEPRDGNLATTSNSSQYGEVQYP